MPGLTVPEKEFRKTRIAARIERRVVEAIRAQHPPPFDRVRRDARAPRSPGPAEARAGLEAVQAEEAALSRRKMRAQRSTPAALRGVPIEEVSDGFILKYGGGLQPPLDATEAPEERQEAHHERLPAYDPAGREIARLEAEDDNLLDTAWRATSPTRVKQSWSRVAELLGDQPTQLEREAPSIEPARED